MRRNGSLASLTFVIVASLTALGLAAVAAHGQASGANPPGTPAPGAWSTAPAEVAHPQGWTAWTWVKSGPSGALLGKPAGTHHIYANDLAVEGYRSGQWPDGAILVFDVLVLEAPHGPATDPASRLRTDVMVRDQARFAATGGWGYASWLEPEHLANAYVQAEPVKACHACHTSRAAEGFVFSTMRE